ncbi:hypothetical protein S7335_3195 [Synechococcus sp. PCC 7335]|uniref:DUF4383 domain-containing protein n=1 Tax=Synechococcus sp. (strain ATCC 29403 / PCC 7335) TaxID=91464 RepID=UPI00017ED8E1|nr:DUF4383 domain-containing protein [Synechococcus sp. PCC 7335]EDX85494.1 hypothetical protein S7335_3195 [Synechococcus sp. PCC 7335]
MSGEKKCALALGLIFTVLGVAGFIPSIVSLPSSAISGGAPISADQLPTTVGANYGAAYLRGFGYLFGLFPTNLLHNIAHLAIGITGLYSATGDRGAFNYNRFFAISYLALGIMGLIPVANRLFGLMPIFGNNVWLNLATGAIAAYYAFVWHPQNADPTVQ